MGITLEDIKLINAGKVDSRTKGSAGHPVLTHEGGALERVYCLYCTKPGGYTSQASSDFIRAYNVVYICDDCVNTLGEPPLQKADIEAIEKDKIESRMELDAQRIMIP